jgi:hypothetical protein
MLRRFLTDNRDQFRIAQRGQRPISDVPNKGEGEGKVLDAAPVARQTGEDCPMSAEQFPGGATGDCPQRLPGACA